MTRRYVRLAAILALPMVLAPPVRAEAPPYPEPILRIETGGHVADIRRIGIDASCRLMATASEDKTARIWTLPEQGTGEPKLLHALRPPIGPGEDGKIHAVAMSPDGRIVAAAGWIRTDADDWVYLFDAVTGKLVRRLGVRVNTTLHLVFSPDGRYLAAVFGVGGLRVWDTASWQLVLDDQEYNGQRSNDAAFDRNGNLYTVAYDGFLRRYGPDLKLEAKAIAAGDKEPHSIAVHPNGDRVAVGFNDSEEIEIYDASTLKRTLAVDTASLSKGTRQQVSWSADGARLYAGGYGLRIYDQEGRGPWRDVTLADNGIKHLLPCRDMMAAATSNAAFGLLSLDGEQRVWQRGAAPDMRAKLRNDFTVSIDGRRLRFGLDYGGRNAFLFDVAAGALAAPYRLVSWLSAPDTLSLPLTDWEDEYAPKLDGKPIELDAYEYAHAVAIAPGSRMFVLGTDWTLRAYDKDGKPLWKRPVTGTVWGVNIPSDGRFVIAAHGDGTILWRRLSDGEEVLALFVHALTREWVLWTPQGIYTASSGGDDLIGWHLNRGWDEAATFVAAARLKAQLRRPDVIARAFELADAGQALQEAGLSASAVTDLVRQVGAERNQ